VHSGKPFGGAAVDLLLTFEQGQQKPLLVEVHTTGASVCIRAIVWWRCCGDGCLYCDFQVNPYVGSSVQLRLTRYHYDHLRACLRQLLNANVNVNVAVRRSDLFDTLHAIRD
jgi:hypothetical protein